KLNDTLDLDSLVLDVTHDKTRVWRAVGSMDFSVKTADGPVKVHLDAAWEKGKEAGDSVKFDAVKGTRTVNGKKNQMDTNPAVLTMEADGRLEVKFVGDGGFTVTIARQAPPAAKPAEFDPAALVGSWGGKMGGADIGSGVKLDVMRVDVARGADDTWTVVVKMVTTFPLHTGTQVVIH